MKIILFRGRPGAGKTTLAKVFAAQENHPLVSKDDLYDPLVGYVKEHSERNKLSYQLLYQILENNLHTNVVFVLDFPFQRDEDFAIIDSWCKEKKVALTSILVTCSDETLWAERVNKRAKNPKPNQLITDFSELKEHYGGDMQLLPKPGELLVDSVDALDVLLQQVTPFIRGHSVSNEKGSDVVQ